MARASCRITATEFVMVEMVPSQKLVPMFSRAANTNTRVKITTSK